MEQFKFSLGPYELFASIIGGIPLVLALSIVYTPAISLQDVPVLIQKTLSTQIIIILILFSYIVGALIQGITWKYFLILCRIFSRDYQYFSGKLIFSKKKQFEETEKNIDPQTLEFEDKIILLLHEKIGIPNNLDWLDSRLNTYLKEKNRPSLATAERYQATHIMYRNMSFGFLILGAVLFINLFRASIFTLEQWIFTLGSIALAYIAFLQALLLKQWYKREILFGFYFAAYDDAQH
ncbi:MAG: hypothetical protein F6K42_01605 [Leptolyngbya sp. SIO1D8]|nr:hypothetical protein [Leptolyngbya sp. SIO1D8]